MNKERIEEMIKEVATKLISQGKFKRSLNVHIMADMILEEYKGSLGDPDYISKRIKIHLLDFEEICKNIESKQIKSYISYKLAGQCILW